MLFRSFEDAGALGGIEAVRSATLPATPDDLFVCVVADGTLRRLFMDMNRLPGEQRSQEVIGHGCTGELVGGPGGHLYFVDTGAGRVRVLLPGPEATP